MATTTPNYGWPVPTSTDLVKDGATAIEALGDAIDATVFALPTPGISLINTTTFTAQSTISLNDVFSATYTNYRIVCNLTGSTDLNVSLRYRVGGADNSTANSYVRQLLRGISATASAAAGADNLALLGSADSTGLTFTADIFNPFATTRTKALNTFLGKSASVADYAALSYFDHNQTTSYTGFSLLTSTGTVTGNISVYGYGK